MKVAAVALALVALGCTERRDERHVARSLASAAAAAPSASAEPAPISPESLPATPRFRQTNTYNGNVVFVPEGCRGSYDVLLHFHGAHPFVKEAVEKANNTPFGLSAGVWTEKGSRILWMADQLRAGVVWANTFNRFDPASPFGGYKESGYGREGGRHGLEAYVR